MIRSVIAFAFVAFACVPHAKAWEPFRSESSQVKRGNELLQKGQSKEALEAYDEAARKLPNEPGVQLNRGLALMKEGKLAPAREAFRNASQGSAPPQIRGEALYDMGLAFMQEAEVAAKGEQLDAAQKSLREAVDAFKGSLRAKPGNRDAGWNLELARRRLVEIDKKKEEQDKKKDEEKKDEEKKDDEQKNDEQKDPNQQPDAGAGDEQNPEQKDQGDQQKPEDQGQDGADKQKPEDKQDPQDKQGDEQKQDAQGKDQKAPEPEENQPKEQPAQQGQEAEPSQGTPEERMPEHMKKALDALESSEENLEKHRAQTRARQRPRRIQKDW